MEYQKRPGTSGIDGQLYETKLLALVLFRLQHDRRVEQFYLATNINDLGEFDDICFVMRMEGHDRPVAVFVQLKHKENEKGVIKFDNKEKIKYVTSFIKIKRKVASRQTWDNFFHGNLIETDCIFVLYTNAKFNITHSGSKYDSSYKTILNSVLATSDTIGCRVQESEQFVENLADYYLKNDLALLAEHFVEFLIDKGTERSVHIMNDEFIQQYHVILRRHVVDVSAVRTDEQQPDMKWRTLSFQQDFFTTNDKYTQIFRDLLFKKTLKKQRDQESVTSRSSTDETISIFLSNPSAATLTPLIITHIECNEMGKLEFLIKRPTSDVELLQRMNISRAEIDEATLTAEKNVADYLRTLQLKAPISFGNVDLAIRGTENKINRRLKYLTTALHNLCKEYEQKESYKIVTMDDHLGDGLLSHNGGLASAVGNLLTYDNETNMLKFSDNFTAEQKMAKKIFDMLEKLIDDIFKYRFIVKTKYSPKLHLDCNDTARDFLNKLVIYEKQGNHWQVEEILKEMIQERLNADSRNSATKCSQISTSVFLHYHEEILKWWMSPESGTYLTKTSNLYEQAIHNMEAEPHISALQSTSMFYMSKTKYFGFSFNKNATKWLELPKLPSKVFITTDTVALTTVKVIQCLRNNFSINKFSVIDIEIVLTMPIEEFNSLTVEIGKTKKVLIIVWYNKNDSGNRLPILALATKGKQLVVVMSKESRGLIIKHFSNANDVFYEETENLSNIESQKNIVKDSKVIFQGQKIGLDLILDDESVNLVKGTILDKVICNKVINIGEPVSNAQYEEIKSLYIDRYIYENYNKEYDDSSDSSNDFSVDTDYASNDDYSSDYNKNVVYNEDSTSSSSSDSSDDGILVKTFSDIQHDVVLLTAPPGMGKSTLLTHLSINTREHDFKLWIVRVNFINYSKQFQKWCEDKIDVDALESLKFLCQIVLKNNTTSFDIDLTNGYAHLTNYTCDELTAFELNVFLHFYNHRRLIFIFDGFDEICPDYKEKVLSFVKVAKIRLQKYKMWVASRPYSDILPDLETVLGRCFIIKSLSFTVQQIYLIRFWEEKLLFKKLKDNQLNNLRTFIENTRKSISEARYWIRRIYNIFFYTIQPLLYPLGFDAEREKISRITNIRPKTKSKRKHKGLSRIPLFLYFLADYFANIVDTAKNHSKSVLKINLHDIYAIFIENKLKKVLFQDKNKMDLSNTLIRRLLEKELDDCINIHKKLAAYTIFIYFKFDDFDELVDMRPLNKEELNIALYKIKMGTEKSGLISHVSNNVPVFIHRSFAEYFAAEYICDILISENFDLSQKVLMYNLILDDVNKDIREWVETKTDPRLRRNLIELKKYSPLYTTLYRDYFDEEKLSQNQFKRILASSVNDYEDGCFSDFGEKFKTKYFHQIYANIQDDVTEYLGNYFISKMKPHLKKYFRGPALFKSRGFSFFKDFELANKINTLDGILLKIKILGHEQFNPLFVLQDHSDAFQMSNNKSCHKIASEDVGQNDSLYICFSERLKPHVSSFESEVNNFMATTSAIGNRLHYSEQDVKDFGEKFSEYELSLLAFDLSKFLNTNQLKFLNTTFPKYIQRYHVFLRQHVFDITDIQTDETKTDMKWRTMTFRNDFFFTDDRHVAFLRNCLWKIIDRNRYDRSIQPRTIALNSIYLFEPTADKLSLLIGANLVAYKDNKLEFVVEYPPSDVERLKQIPQSVIDEAILAVRTAVIVYLRSIELKVSIYFGNIDLSCGDFPNIHLSINHLKSKIVQLCKQSTTHKVVVIDDTLGEEFLSEHSGLNSCVGNILVYDEETCTLKFSNLHQFTPAQENAKFLYLELSQEIDNLHEYRFEVRTDLLPKCHLDHTNIARQFLNRLVIFAEQSNHCEVEEVLFNLDWSRLNYIPGLPLSVLSLLHTYSEVLKWWMSSKSCEDVIKLSKLYEYTLYNVTTEPTITDLHSGFHCRNFKYFGYTFSESAANLTLELPVIPRKLFIVTETVILTTIKFMQRLKRHGFSNEYAVIHLDILNTILDSWFDTYSLLCVELRNTTKVLIIPCTQKSVNLNMLCELAQLVEHKRIVVIADNEFRISVESRFEWSNVVFNSEIESLSTILSHKEIMRDTKVIFQGQNVTLDVIMDDESVAHIKGDVLAKVINNDIIHIGSSLSYSRPLIGRRTLPVRISDGDQETCNEVKFIRTFYDIVDEVVLLKVPPELDKSTLLRHLVLNTKECEQKLWIVRVNFNDHVEQFLKWQDEETVIDARESLLFLCQVTLNSKMTSFNLAFVKDKACLDSCEDDGLATFELNIFLHFYNERRVILVFNDVDDIDPYYKDKVIIFLSVAATRLRKNRMWVSSSTNNNILRDLQRVLGTGYTIEGVQ